jgi:ribosomal protein S18 acetylase RimI-like enzyme
MNIDICEINFENQNDFGRCDMSFRVTFRLILHAEEARIAYTIADVTPYTKNYGPRLADYAEYGSHPDDRMIFLAYANGELAGEVRMRETWNKFAYLDDFVVEPKYRGQGVGRALVRRCIDWAKAKGFPGISLETQDINVPACKLYESCGFELRGFDSHLYKALDPSTNEIALYWYLIF